MAQANRQRGPEKVPTGSDDPEAEGKDARQSWERVAAQGVSAAEEGLEQLVRAGKVATDAATKALLSIDFEGIGEAMSSALQKLASVGVAKQPEFSPYIVDDKGAASRGVFKLVGGCILLVFGIPLLFMGVAVLSTDTLSAVVALVLALVLTVQGIRLAREGIEDRQLSRTLRQVSRVAAASVRLHIDELSAQVGMAAPRLRHLLERGVAKGLLPQGRIVKLNGQDVLYLTDGAYQADKASAAEAQARARAAQKRAEADAAEDAADAALPEAARRVVAACESYVDAAQAATPDLLDARTRELSLELARKVDKVADRARRDPSLAPGLERFASYYLPTAARMVASAAELDREGAVGDNAAETREQVADTLGMLSNATTKLLDDLLAERTWDIAADAGVMRTMLRQDGLADDEGPASGPKRDHT